MPRAESYVRQWSVSTLAGWTERATSGTGEGITVGTEYAELAAGGATGDHNAGYEWDIIANDGRPLTSKITATFTFYLLSDFYTQLEGAVRVFEINNEANGGFGSSAGDNLDVHFGFTAAGLPQLVSQDDTTTLTLWTGTQLAVDTWHTVIVVWSPSQTTRGTWSVDVNGGEQAASATDVQTVPGTVLAADIELTYIHIGLPDADIQDTNLLTLRLQLLEVAAWQDTIETPWHWWSPPTSITSPGTPTINPTRVYNLRYFNGTDWDVLQPWRWNGTIWEELETTIQYWDGAAWST